jgi:sugar phosphate isomerase/epimerase
MPAFLKTADAPKLGPMSTLSTGLVSVSFRQLDVPQIVALAKQANLSFIEWGADIHVQPGDTAAATAAKAVCEAAGVGISAYGSYYRAGVTPPAVWDAVLASARALGAPTIRIWAGNIGSAEADAATRQRIVADVTRVCSEAAKYGISVTIEYHGGTLTDTLPSAVALYESIGHANFRAGWQPRHGISTADGAAEIRTLRPWLGNVHVFHWWPTNATRHPLADGFDRWKTFLQTIAEDGVRRVALLEFFKGDSPEQMKADAKTLHELIASVAT